jgi:hypothetical protein
MKTAMSRTSFVTLLAVFAGLWPVAAQEPPLPKINVVLFTPADVAPPKDAVRRLTQVADYTEAFLVKWMKHWGYPPAREKFLDRNPDSTVRVLFVSGKEKRAGGKYNKPGFEVEVRQSANAKYQLGQHGHVWWIWVYLGDPPLRFEGFEGRGTMRAGGTAWANYLNAAGEIRVTDEIGAPFLESFALKGGMHELGHALGLPHVGPLDKQPLGMPLMGANIPNYRKHTGKSELRGYVSQAEAAMLWKHPVFTGTAKDRNVTPKFTVAGLATSYDAATKSVRLRGALKTNYPAHSVVVFDSVPGVHENYWQKPYVGRIAKDGQFEVVITEPSAKAGTLRLMFCFQNGASSGDSQTYGIASMLEKPYRATGGGYQLAP